MSTLDHTYALILAGGGGTRLWPKSRNATPKQFLKLVGDKTMMQLCADRIHTLIPWEKIIVITNALYKDEVARQLPEVPLNNIIAEPEKRDTALAMLTGALYAKMHDPEAVVINCASDHTVLNETEFVRVMKAAAQVAATEPVLVTVGITPTRPATGFGYIKIGPELSKIDTRLPLFKVDSFTEKPNEATAQAFISTGRYFWNANMYVWKATTLLESFKTHMASLYDRIQPLLTSTEKTFHGLLPEMYAASDTISIDYAISEKATNLVLLPGDFGWNDVGDWKVVYDLAEKDGDFNVIMNDTGADTVMSLKSHHNLIHTDKRLVALYGINDMIIVDTDEILLIMPKSQSQDVKKLVEKLKEENKKEYL